MAPAIRPARSEDRPSVGETDWASCVSNDSGSEPYLRISARSRASCSLKSPVILVLPLICCVTCGADTTSVSSTNATSAGVGCIFDFCASCAVSSDHFSLPSLVKSMLTWQPAPSGFTLDVELETIVPSSTTGPSTYACGPASEFSCFWWQATNGRSGRSLPRSGSSNLGPHPSSALTAASIAALCLFWSCEARSLLCRTLRAAAICFLVSSSRLSSFSGCCAGARSAAEAGALPPPLPLLPSPPEEAFGLSPLDS